MNDRSSAKAHDAPTGQWIENRLREGFRLQSAGDVEGAEAIYRAAHQMAPDDARALTLLASILEGKGDRTGAGDFYRKALRAAPDAPAPRLKLAALALEGDDALTALGLIRSFTDRYPRELKGWRLRARAATAAERQDEAVECWERAEALGDPRAAGNLGKALQMKGDHGAAADAYRRLSVAEPGNATAFAALGDACAKSADHQGAIESFTKALKLNPDHREAQAALGAELQAVGRFEAAATCYLDVAPHVRNQADVLNNLGNCRLSQGRPRLAQSIYREALRLEPENEAARRNLCMALAYDDGVSSAELAKACRDSVAGLPIAPRQPSARRPGAPLRVGFVSADFRRHSVAAFIEPLFAHFDPSEMQVFAYSLTASPDGVTERLSGMATQWREARDWSAEEAATAIRDDRVDILIDLAGQTSEARFDIFAARPAPVQASWLGWPATTGFDAIDFKISDALLTPADMTEVLTETPYNLAGPALAFQPPDDAPPVAAAPILQNGYPTFGSFNKAFKASPRTLALWAGVMTACADARLFLKDSAFRCPDAIARFHDRLDQAGIAPDRVTLMGAVESRAQHLALYGEIDVALDSAPYNGVTTTCEALWMGVPTVSIVGDQALSRYGLSVLTHAGQGDCVAMTAEGFIDRAAALVAEPMRLAARRRNLRQRLLGSPLLDGPAFAQSFAEACRGMVRKAVRQAV